MFILGLTNVSRYAMVLQCAANACWYQTFTAIYIEVPLIISRWHSFLQHKECWSVSIFEDTPDIIARSSLAHSQTQAHQHGQQHEGVDLGLDQE
jgi:hypothetical protein